MPKDSFLKSLAGAPSVLLSAFWLSRFHCMYAQLHRFQSLPHWLRMAYSSGAALIFLMAGPATNVATLGAVYETLGKRMLAVYLFTIVIGSVLLAVVFDAMYGNFGQDIAAAGENCGLPHQVSSGVLLIVLGLFAFEAIRDKLKAMMTKTPTTSMVTVPVNGMTCGGCVRRLTGVLEELDGAENVVVT